jgi:glutamate synthase (NADPH/NADH) large chain
MTGGIVIVLGATGRNFAAGMSGGIAYVLDESGGFEKLCNMAMVDLEPVPAEEEVNARFYHSKHDLETAGRVEILTDMTRFDAERLRYYIGQHAKLTGSTRAQAILDDWKTYCGKFRKVMPLEYRRALKEIQAAQALEAAE